MKLLFNALLKFLVGFLFVGTLVFLPAGTLAYIDGWVFIAVLFIPIFIMGIVLLCKAPELLKKRLDSREKEKTQKGVVAFSGLVFLASFVVSGLDYNFGWSSIPKVVKIISALVFIAFYGIYAEVMRENAYLSRVIKVQENQTVVSTGLYGIVRHPMYAATIFMFLCIPLILGSLISFFIMLAYPMIIVVRIINEEKVLTEQLEGYKEYKQKVKYRIIPLVW